MKIITILKGLIFSVVIVLSKQAVKPIPLGVGYKACPNVGFSVAQYIA